MIIVKKPIRYLLLLLFLAGIQLLWPTADVSAADLVIGTSADIFTDDAGVYAYYFAPERSAYELYFGYDSDYGNVNKAAVRFDLNGIENRPIKKAELKIYVINYTRNPESAVPFVNVWESNNDTWADADGAAFPSEDKKIIENYTFASGDINSWKSIDVTSYIESQYTGDKMATLVLIGDQSTTPDKNRSFIAFYDHLQGGDWGARLEITYVPPPTIFSISPNQGPLAGGNSVAISGENLDEATSATIGGNAAAITGNTDTVLTVTVPAGTAGAKDVVVATVVGSTTGTGLYTYVLAPTVSSISPNQGPLAGGTSVTITGTNLTGATAVTIGGNTATGITVVNDTTITVTVPSGTAGAKDVVVTTAGGSGTGVSLYTYITTPIVTTNSVTNITATGAEITGSVSADGGAAITERGFVYGNAENPIITDLKQTVTGTTGEMTATLTGLIPSTPYHVRAYATNNVGTSYGSDVSFDTAAKTVTIAANPALSEENLDTASLDVTLDGDTFADASLDKANFTLNNAPGGLTVETVTHDSATTCTVDLAFDETDFYDDKNLSLTINGAELAGYTNLTSNGLTITAKAKTAPTVSLTTVTNVTASAAHLASAVIADGGGGVSVCGFVYGTEPSPTLDKVEFGGAIGTIEADLINLRPNTTYYARSYAGNSIGTSYSPDVSFITMATGVTIAADPALTRQDLNTARLNATVEWDAFIDDALDKNNFLLNNAPDGLSVADVVYSTETTCVIDLAYDGTDFTGNRNISLTINGTELTGSDNLTSNELTITNATEPDAPTNVTATAGNKQATVYFPPPLNNGGSAITGYIVTSAPGNITATGSASPITVTGLNNGTPYTFTVTAVNAIGNSPPSGASPAVTPKASSSSGHSNSNKTISAADKIVPEEGGEINLGSEVKLDIPAGALQGTDPVNISITKVSSPPLVPSGFVLLGQVYELSAGESGSCSFNEPVTITFTFDPELVPPGFQSAVHYYNINTGEWVNIEGTVSGDKISITIDHFTEFAVMAVKTPDQPEPVPDKFTDIKGHWAEAAINQVADSGMIKGYADGTFRPDQTITRAEFTVVLVKALQLNSGTNRYYKDSARHWARDYISIAAANGIINGYDADTFGPDDPITREQMAVMAIKASQLDKVAPGKKFADDSSISAWARDSIYTAWANEIIGGYPDHTIKPLTHTTRAEAVTVINLLLNRKHPDPA